ncbi:hypothetical protein Syn7502_02239 [Synechococcus sp. PCC 7502]|nr:hypothetical protein Syn7502_02239 [Synechococcus sp. PCC 7502]
MACMVKINGFMIASIGLDEQVIYAHIFISELSVN